MANEGPSTKKTASNLYLGFDISTQQVNNTLCNTIIKLQCIMQLKVIAVDDGLEVYTELSVEYDSDLKEYK